MGSEFAKPGDIEPGDIEDVSLNLRDVEARIAAAATAAGRAPAEVTLVAVSKMQPEGRIRAALAAGHRVFGENRVQEAAGRWPGLRAACPGVALHLLGPLQTNKVKQALDLFDTIQSVDRPSLARALATQMERRERRPDCFIQVNTGAEPQKAGVLPADVDAFIDLCRDELALPVVGLMCIPPVEDEPSPHFAFLREIGRRHGLSRLSMGMSADYDVAVRFGATHVRVGTAIFGPRSAR